VARGGEVQFPRSGRVTGVAWAPELSGSCGVLTAPTTGEEW